MALDTKYRPRTYDDVLGQEATVAVLRQFVKEGRGFHQSYVFCGQHGSGKTTLGRILARALLCLTPTEAGSPCDQCASCKTFLEGRAHESFEELDAATKSGKGDLTRIIEELDYSTFSGNRRIYLFDESHRLSKQALDVLLKPMEDNAEGTEDKKLVCIFCTTDPGKMSSTIFSRCAPAFVIRPVSPEGIAERLMWVCGQEGIQADLGALVTIAEVTECHIRDALKTVEGVSMLGEVSRENVFQYLQLGANDIALSILEAVGSDLQGAVALATEMATVVSPSSAYERLADGAMSAYRAHLGVGRVPAQWNQTRIEALASRGESLLGIASRFSAPPHRPTRHTLVLDIGALHYALVGKVPPSKMVNLTIGVSSAPSPVQSPVPAVQHQTPPPVAPEPSSAAPPKTPSKPPSANFSETKAPVKTAGTVSDDESRTPRVVGDVWLDSRAVGRGPSAEAQVSDQPPVPTNGVLPPNFFRDLVQHHLKEMTSGGRKGRPG